MFIHKYCSYCGVLLPGKPPVICSACTGQNYDPVKLAVCVLPYCYANGEWQVLLEKRASPSRYGMWAVPAGLIEVGFGYKRKAVIEIEEETSGLVKAQVEKVEFMFFTEDAPHFGTAVVCSKVQISYIDIRSFVPNSEVSELRWLRRSEWLKSPFELAFPAHTQMLNEFFNPRSSKPLE